MTHTNPADIAKIEAFIAELPKRLRHFVETIRDYPAITSSDLRRKLKLDRWELSGASGSLTKLLLKARIKPLYIVRQRDGDRQWHWIGPPSTVLRRVSIRIARPDYWRGVRLTKAAVAFLQLVERSGSVESTEVMARLGIERSSKLAALTRSISLRLDSAGVKKPYRTRTAKSGRTVWIWAEQPET